MDLMKVHTSYRELSHKYMGFRAPTLEIEVGSAKLIQQKKLQITELELELTCENQASGCVFYIEGAYLPVETDFSQKTDVLQIGEEVKVSIGYIRTEHIFAGYINQVDFVYGMEHDTILIRVECIDALGILMKNRRLEFFRQKSADKVVKEIISAQPFAGYIRGKEIDTCPEEEIECRTSRSTDFQILSEQAKKYSYEFFVSQGKFYFRKEEKEKSTVLKLSPKMGIQKAQLSLSAQSLYETAEVRSIDSESAKVLKGEASVKGSFSKGKTGSKLIGKTRQIFYEPEVKDVNEAKQRAASHIKEAQTGFARLNCICVGIPELGPGRFVEIEGLSDRTDGRYYITQVRHTINGEGFLTSFTARRDCV